MLSRISRCDRYRWWLLACALWLLSSSGCSPAKSQGLRFFQGNGRDGSQAQDVLSESLALRSASVDSLQATPKVAPHAVPGKTRTTVQRARDAEKRDDPSAVDLYAAATLELYGAIHETNTDLDCELFSTYHECLRGFLANALVHQRWDPSKGIRIELGQQSYRIQVACTGPHWTLDDHDAIRLASEFSDVKLENYWIDEGMGLPLVSIREREPAESYIAERVPFSTTAVLKPSLPGTGKPDASYTSLQATSVSASIEKEPVIGVLELHDPMMQRQVDVGQRPLPLTRDLSAPWPGPAAKFAVTN